MAIKAITSSTTTVFADLGYPDAKMHAAKAALVARMHSILDDRGLTQSEASELTGIDLSHILRGQFRDTALDELLTCLTRLGCDVELVVRPSDGCAFAPICLEAKIQ